MNIATAELYEYYGNRKFRAQMVNVT